MSITTEDNRTAELTTNGVETEFDFSMLIHADTEVQVWYQVTDGDYTQLTLDTHYTVVFTEDGGTVTTIGGSSPYAAGKILIIRHLALTQQTNWLYNDAHTEQTHQDDFDRSVMRDLQIQEQLDRSVGFAIHSGTFGIEFPEPVASAIIGWNAAGDALENKELLGGLVDLADPDADRILFWDDGADEVAFLQVSTGLTLAGTTLATNDAQIDHDSLSNFVANEHYLQSAITEVGTIATGVWEGTDVGVAHGGTGASNTGGARTNLGLVIGTDVLAYDVGIQNLAGIAMGANKFYYTSADNTHVAASVTAFARTILDDANEATFKATVNLEIGTDVLAEQTIGIADDNLLEVDGTPNSGEYARFTLNGLEGRTEAEFKVDFNLEIGTDVLAQQAIGIADNNLLEVDGTPNLGEIAYFTANGIDGATIQELSDALEATIDHDNLLNTHQDVKTTASPEWVGATLSGLTQGSVLFAGAGGVVSEDTTNLLWNDTTNILTTSGLTVNGEIRANSIQKIGGGDLLIGNTDQGVFNIGGDSANSIMSAQFNNLVFEWYRISPTAIAQTILFRGKVGGNTQNYFIVDGHPSATDPDYQIPYVRFYVKSYFDGDVGFGGETDPETLSEWTGTAPYLTLHNSTHENTDGGRESRLIFKGEQGVDPFAETELAMLEVSHDGTGNDQLGKIVLSVNTGAGLVEGWRLDSLLRFGIATTPTARLHLPAGVATAGLAPLKLTSGTDLTTPEAGVIEYDGSHFSVTEIIDRRVISVASDSLTTAVTVASTVSETTVFTAAISADELHVGKVLRIEGAGQASTHDAADTITVRIKIGTTVLTSLAMTPGQAADDCMHFYNIITIRTTGAGGTLASHGHIEIADSGIHENDEDVAIDTTIAEDITVTFQWNDANAGNTATLDQCFLEILV